MSRTMFVNPGLFRNPKKAAAKKRKPRKHGKKQWKRGYIRGRVALATRNAGIAPFVQNPLILSNPRRRSRRRRSNPISMPSMRSAVDFGLSTASGAVGALTLNTVGMSRIGNAWGRRAAQFGAAVVGGSMISKKSSNMGASFAGAMMYPLIQDIAADLLGIGFAAGASSKEADIDALAADIEDVLEGMDEDGGFGDDEEEYAW